MAEKDLPRNLTCKTTVGIPALGPPSGMGTIHGCCSDPDNSGGDSEEPELTIVLVGKTGAGKSTTGNILLGRREFESKASGGSVTKVCRKARATWNERDIAVIDTPGIFDTEGKERENLNEIARFMTLSSPGPHALLLVLQVGRFTQEEKGVVNCLYHLLGAEAMKFLIIVFTRKDDLGEESLGDYVRTIDDPFFQELWKKCEHQGCALDNKASGAQKDAQLSELMAMIEKMVQNNGGTHYTNNLYKSVEELLQKETEARQQQYMEQFKRQKRHNNSQWNYEDNWYKDNRKRARSETEELGSVFWKVLMLVSQFVLSLAAGRILKKLF